MDFIEQAISDRRSSSASASKFGWGFHGFGVRGFIFWGFNIEGLKFYIFGFKY